MRAGFANVFAVVMFSPCIGHTRLVVRFKAGRADAIVKAFNRGNLERHDRKVATGTVGRPTLPRQHHSCVLRRGHRAFDARLCGIGSGVGGIIQLLGNPVFHY